VTPTRSRLTDADGATSLDEDEIAGLIPANVQTRAELNAWEATNIAEAVAWAYTRSHVNILRMETLRELHRRMFGAIWTWAGTFRRSDNNISPHHWPQVPTLMGDLVDDTQAQYGNHEPSDPVSDEVAVRFHHRLVQIHPWPNGNGRHARLATDLLLREWNRPVFTWGGAASHGIIADMRSRYLSALRAADAGNLDELSRFARS
jgi:Fic-DOC domain mobile mystery protein B